MSQYKSRYFSTEPFNVAECYIIPCILMFNLYSYFNITLKKLISWYFYALEKKLQYAKAAFYLHIFS